MIKSMSTTSIEREMAAKHPLATQWTAWYDYQEKRYVTVENWSANLQILGTMGDVESFWGFHDELGDVGTLPQSSNLHFFRAGIEPMWEDKANIGGGKWVLEVPATESISGIWQDTLLFCISETSMVTSNADLEKENMGLQNSDIDITLDKVVCGAVLSPRKHYVRVSIWTSIKDGSVAHVGKMWKRFASIPDDVPISFKAHENALKGNRDGVQDLYVI